MIVISLLNRKGGAGKTTASVNLAAIFAELKGKRVLLTDIDTQANATTYLDKNIIIDCPPARNNLTTNALTASDYTILPCEATEYGIDSIFAMNEFISNIQQCVNSNLKVAGILFTKKENTSVQKFYVEQFKAALKSYHFFDTEIRKTTIVEKSLTEHQPLIIYGKREEVTKDYIKVADELEKIIKETGK